MHVRKYIMRLTPVVMAFALLTGLATPAAAATGTFTGVSVSLSNPTAGATGVTYTVTVGGGVVNTSGIQCVRVRVDSEPSLDSGSQPAGFAISGAYGGSMFSGGTWAAPATAGNATDWVASSGSATAAAGTLTFTAANPSAKNTGDRGFFLKVETFTNTTCDSTSATDKGAAGFQITDNTVVSVTVDPTLTFAVANRATACNGESNYIDNSSGNAAALSLGRIAAGVPSSSGQSLTLGTNAGGGFTVYIRGNNATGNLRNGSHNFQDVAGTNAAPAAFGAGERFGYTALGTGVTFTSNNFAALDATARAVMTAGSGTQSGSGCVAFQVQAATTTPAGAYSATVIYSAVPTF